MQQRSGPHYQKARDEYIQPGRLGKITMARTWWHGNGYHLRKAPATLQISHQEQVLDILRNTTTNPTDKVKEFSLKTSGESYGKLFDSTVKVLVGLARPLGKSNLPRPKRTSP